MGDFSEIMYARLLKFSKHSVNADKGSFIPFPKYAGASLPLKDGETEILRGEALGSRSHSKPVRRKTAH